MALALAACVAAAEEDASAAPEQFLTAQAGTPRPLLELSSAEVPRLDSADASMRASRTHLTLFPTMGSIVGLSVGMTSSSGPATLLAPYGPGGPLLDLGLHWRHEMDGNRLDVTAWRRVGNTDAISLIQSRDPDYGVRAELGFGSGKQGLRTGFVADRGFVGLQLDGGARLTVRRSGGRPMLYYRNTF